MSRKQNPPPLLDLLGPEFSDVVEPRGSKKRYGLESRTSESDDAPKGRGSAGVSRSGSSNRGSERSSSSRASKGRGSASVSRSGSGNRGSEISSSSRASKGRGSASVSRSGSSNRGSERSSSSRASKGRDSAGVSRSGSSNRGSERSSPSRASHAQSSNNDEQTQEEGKRGDDSLNERGSRNNSWDLEDNSSRVSSITQPTTVDVQQTRAMNNSRTIAPCADIFGPKNRSVNKRSSSEISSPPSKNAEKPEKTSRMRGVLRKASSMSLRRRSDKSGNDDDLPADGERARAQEEDEDEKKSDDYPKEQGGEDVSHDQSDDNDQKSSSTTAPPVHSNKNNTRALNIQQEETQRYDKPEDQGSGDISNKFESNSSPANVSPGGTNAPQSADSSGQLQEEKKKRSVPCGDVFGHRDHRYRRSSSEISSPPPTDTEKAENPSRMRRVLRRASSMSLRRRSDECATDDVAENFEQAPETDEGSEGMLKEEGGNSRSIEMPPSAEKADKPSGLRKSMRRISFRRQSSRKNDVEKLEDIKEVQGIEKKSTEDTLIDQDHDNSSGKSRDLPSLARSTPPSRDREQAYKGNNEDISSSPSPIEGSDIASVNSEAISPVSSSLSRIDNKQAPNNRTRSLPCADLLGRHRHGNSSSRRLRSATNSPPSSDTQNLKRVTFRPSDDSNDDENQEGDGKHVQKTSRINGEVRKEQENKNIEQAQEMVKRRGADMPGEQRHDNSFEKGDDISAKGYPAPQSIEGKQGRMEEELSKDIPDKHSSNNNTFRGGDDVLSVSAAISTASSVSRNKDEKKEVQEEVTTDKSSSARDTAKQQPQTFGQILRSATEEAYREAWNTHMASPEDESTKDSKEANEEETKSDNLSKQRGGGVSTVDVSMKGSSSVPSKDSEAVNISEKTSEISSIQESGGNPFGQSEETSRQVNASFPTSSKDMIPTQEVEHTSETALKQRGGTNPFEDEAEDVPPSAKRAVNTFGLRNSLRRASSSFRRLGNREDRGDRPKEITKTQIEEKISEEGDVDVSGESTRSRNTFGHVFRIASGEAFQGTWFTHIAKDNKETKGSGSTRGDEGASDALEARAAPQPESAQRSASKISIAEFADRVTTRKLALKAARHARKASRKASRAGRGKKRAAFADKVTERKLARKAARHARSTSRASHAKKQAKIESRDVEVAEWWLDGSSDDAAREEIKMNAYKNEQRGYSDDNPWWEEWIDRADYNAAIEEETTGGQKHYGGRQIGEDKSWWIYDGNDEKKEDGGSMSKGSQTQQGFTKWIPRQIKGKSLSKDVQEQEGNDKCFFRQSDDVSASSAPASIPITRSISNGLRSAVEKVSLALHQSDRMKDNGYEDFYRTHQNNDCDDDLIFVVDHDTAKVAPWWVDQKTNPIGAADDSIWPNETSASADAELKQPFYKRRWFWICLIILVLAGLIIVILLVLMQEDKEETVSVVASQSPSQNSLNLNHIVKMPSQSPSLSPTSIEDFQRSALDNLFISFNGAHWHNSSGWGSLDVNMCAWYGVTCTTDGNDFFVNKLELPANNLAGDFLIACRYLLYLPELEQLDLKSNVLAGNLTALESNVLAPYTSLIDVDLRLNELTGSISSELCDPFVVFDGSLRVDCDIDCKCCNHDELCGPTQEGQKKALATLFNATNGIGWHDKSRWILGPSMCEWHGIVCNNSSDVVGLDLSWNGLEGSLPSEIGLLTRLEFLYLCDNDLNSHLPSEIGLLHSLKFLNLSRNEVAGFLPSEIGSLSELVEIHLFGNYFAGFLPSQIGLLNSLSVLDLWRNHLTGAIPSEIGLLNSLSLLDLSNNYLSGSLPTEIGMLHKLGRLDISRNHLTGSLPTEIGLLKQLVDLHLRANSLTGSLPSHFGLLDSLQALWMEENSFTGTMLPEVCILVKRNDTFWRLSTDCEEIECTCCTDCCVDDEGCYPLYS